MNVGDKWREWTIEELLGEGAFGQVFKVVRHDMGHDYYSALKVINIPNGKSEYYALKSQGMTAEEIQLYCRDIAEDFSNELQLMDELKGHSNIVSYENHLVEQNRERIGWTIYIRMELLTPLIKYYQDNPPSESDIIKLGIDICTALEACRKNKIIHRDIKPANIFISKFGDYKLGDFGIARRLEGTQSGLSKKGTYTYMAPEVYLGKPYNHTVDIYSLGIVLYILLNDNRAPFVPAPPEIPRYNVYDSALQRRMSGEELPPPRHASAELAKVVLKACAYDPGERYQTPDELKKALKAVLNKPRNVDTPEVVKAEQPKIATEKEQPEQKQVPPKPETATQFADDKKAGTVTQYADGEKPGTVTQYADGKKPKTEMFQQEDIPFRPLTVKQSAYNLKKPEYADAVKKLVTVPPKPKKLNVLVQNQEAAKPKRKKIRKRAVIIPALSLFVVVAIVLGVVIVRSNVVAVGNNNFEQLNIWTPWRDITEIASSNSHTLGLKKDGTVIATGDKEYGKCEVGEWKEITAISAGYRHSVGLKNDGTAVAVGDNSKGQCDVESWTDLVAIAAGTWHTVGLKKNGTVVAVGRNDSSQCNVESWTDITAIAAGVGHTVGLKKDGTVVAIGYNVFGQLYDQCDVEDWTDITAIAVGDSHTVGLKKDGTVVAVGVKTNGQCDVESWTDIVAISAGWSHTVGLKNDGTVVAVGDRSEGQCDVSDWKDIKSISAGDDYTFGIKEN
ncbi:MAG: protein kinase [Ruminococcus sp.]|nr:protein kinase [Ruminococcus sp.]